MINKKKILWYNKDLGKYVHRRMKEEDITRDELDEDTINFFYQQFRTRGSEGHSEWSESFQCNMWIKDEEN